MAIYNEPLHDMFWCFFWWGSNAPTTMETNPWGLPRSLECLYSPKMWKRWLFYPLLCLQMAIKIMAQKICFFHVLLWDLYKCYVDYIKGSFSLDYWPCGDIFVHMIVKMSNFRFLLPFMTNHWNLRLFSRGQCSIYHGKQSLEYPGHWEVLIRPICNKTNRGIFVPVSRPL